MIRKIALIKPEVEYPVKKQGYAGDVGIPLGLLYLAGYVREHNNSEVKIIDRRLQKALGIRHTLEQEIGDAEVVGVGACTAEAPDAFQVMREAKALGRTTVMGGIYPTFNTDEVMRSGVVDYVVRGEGELGLSKLLKALDGKTNLEEVPGLTFLRSGELFHTSQSEMIRDLDTIPMPAYDLVPMKTYAEMSPAAIYAARGCPKACKFCTLNQFWDFRYRKRSIDNVLSELELFKNYGFTRVHFKDETITLNQKWCGELFDAIGHANLGMSYKAKSRVDGINESLLQRMVSAGLDTIHTGIESISERNLVTMSKQISVEQIQSAFDVMLQNGCKVNPVYLFGWMGQTQADLFKDSQFIEKTASRGNVITYISFITPHPGSNLTAISNDDLLVLSRDYARYTHKQPVAVPRSLGVEGLDLMVEQYHHLGKICNAVDVNPPINTDYLDEARTIHRREFYHSPENTLKGGQLQLVTA